MNKLQVIFMAGQQVLRRRDVFAQAAHATRAATFAGGSPGPFALSRPLWLTRNLCLVGRPVVSAQEQCAAVIGRAGEAVVAIGIDLEHTDGSSHISLMIVIIYHAASSYARTVFEICRIAELGRIVYVRDRQSRCCMPEHIA